jgi:hypothetical protein
LADHDVNTHVLKLGLHTDNDALIELITAAYLVTGRLAE